MSALRRRTADVVTMPVVGLAFAAGLVIGLLAAALFVVLR